MIMMMNAAVGNIFPFLPSLSKTLSYSSSPTLFFPILSPRTPSTRSLVIETTTVAEAQTSEEARSESVARRLILLRHAKSSWDDRSLRDHDRPLSKAGQADAIEVSHKLQQLGWIPELILSRCMGHNRGWEEAASMFSGTSIELKTCNAALLEATGKSWEEAFSLAGFGGWKLQGIVKPNSNL
ncbi:uncharacterized protein LOC114295427 isoform X2 [Camellia sinensis]|uniref:uncharacterized protein LOC114295427 isoform X2 n=1 Tax=Camellia sinensis TaxID=4442 RepID=UPI0010358EC2|nr:uncharacterized protein LOC114295427 isoform X2 [Camellia sinensis]